MISVYVDQGAGSRSVRFLIKALKEEGFQTKRLNSKQIIHEDWEEITSLLIFPGGRDIPYDRALRGEGNLKIRNFVESGGRYLGICAGGYYGCASIEFEKGLPLEVIEERELGFFPGTARGSVYNPGTFEYEGEGGSAPAILEWNGESGSVYFNGGCSFIEAESAPGTTVVARYSDIEGSPAAIIDCKVGKGKATLCGVHPEYSARYFPAHHPHILPHMEKSENFRKRLFQKLVRGC